MVAGALLRTQKISHEVLPALSTLEVCGHDVTNLIYTVSTLAIVTGVIVVCVSCVGMFGAGFEVKGMLITVSRFTSIFIRGDWIVLLMFVSSMFTFHGVQIKAM